MDTRRICESCQTPLAPDAPLGLCPQCLVKAGLPTEADSGARSASAPRFVPPAIEDLARLFPQLEILQLLGQGGMGAVYKARQKQLHRTVALKILPPSLGADEAFAARFAREAQALAQLNHPGIVTLYEFGQAGGMPFFLMEFVDGVNLGQALANGRIHSREALSIVPQICDALQFAHDQGIVHRDIKPENILLDRRGRVKVADFGLAILARGGVDAAGGSDLSAAPANLTEAGKVVGTPRYMSPEQLERPGEVDRRADIYALGVVFYQMLTGELPGKSIEPPSRKAHLDSQLDAVVLRALERKPELRYQQASEFKTSVEKAAGITTPTPLAEGAARRSRRLAIIMGVVALLVLVGAILMVTHLPPPPAASRPTPLVSLAQTLQAEVGRQFREAGATYDDLKATVWVKRDSATPFQVTYRGLRNFKGSDGTTPAVDGSFVMEYIGGGQWQGTLAGTRFTVTAGSRDNIDLPFVDDPQVIGEWKSVDIVATIGDFDPANRQVKTDLYLKTMTFLPQGKTQQPWWTWTKGVLIHKGDRTASHYEIRHIKGSDYLFLEWKSGDFTILGKKPPYYVLQRNQESKPKE